MGGSSELQVVGGGGRMRLLYSVERVTGNVRRILLIIVQCAACDRDSVPDIVAVFKSRRVKGAAVCNTTVLLR